MNRITSMSGLVALILGGLGCVASTGDTTTVELSEANDLGATTIQTDRFQENGQEVFELRGLSDTGEELAMIRSRVGDIADLADYLPGPETFGTEITIAGRGDSTRSLSRDVERVVISSADPALQQFLELAPVSSQLASRHVVVDQTLGGDRAERSFDTYVALPEYFNTTPLAKGACYGDNKFEADPDIERFVNAAGSMVVKQENPSWSVCKAADGVSACSGASCFYGPNGFARPVVTLTTPTHPYFKMVHGVFTRRDFTTYQYCNYAYSNTPPVHEFPDVTGTFPTNQGCPGGNSGAGDWD